ncbi:ComEA family DNA-binding protein [Paenibacillus thalictri]|nr:helix-hairpin-helix domain-containing protein [Paenibacillus thalictri]
MTFSLSKTKWAAAAVLLFLAVLAVTFYPAFFAARDAEDGWRTLNGEMKAMLERQGTASAPIPQAKPDNQQKAEGSQAGSEPKTAQTVPAKEAVAAKKIDINTAGEKLLEELPGIGASKAKAIIAYREQHGPFQTAEEITKVKGIGPKMYEKLQERITIGKNDP